MISMSSIKSAGGTSKYLSGQAAAEYYAGQQVPSRWLGQGAEHQGLAGREVAESDLTRQLEGKVIEFSKASGQWEEIQLGVQRGGGLQHRAGWDLTFSAPKSVSLEAEVFGNADVRAAHEMAVASAMGFLEDKAAQARIAGNFVQTRSLCYATFAHATSRAGDPQTHTHAIIANVTYSDGKAYSLSNEKLLDYRTTADVVYKNELAHALGKAGYAVEWDKSGNFEIAGYRKEDLATFSKRSEEIGAALASRGMDKQTASHAARQTAALDTRQDKDHPESADSHRERWQAEAEACGINRTERGTAQQPGACALQQSARDAVLSAINHLTEREQAFRERDLWKEAARFSQGSTNTDRLDEAMLALIHEGSLILRSDGKYTTSDAVESEKTMGERLASGHGAHEAVMSHREFDHALRLFEERKGWALSGEQRVAARMILTGEDRFQGVQGLAGTGKTTMLELVREAAQSRGWEVRGFSNGGAQADKMQQESGIASTTTARHLIDSDRIIRDAALAARALDTFDKNSGPFGEIPNFKELSRGVDKGWVKLEFDGEKRACFTDKNGNTWTKCLFDATTQIETGDSIRYRLTGKGVFREGAGGWEKATPKEAVAVRAQCALETSRNRSAALAALQAAAARSNGETRKILQVCDEASMSGQKEINRVIDTTLRAGAKTLFLGDENQHQSVAAGKGFELAQNHMPMSVLGQGSIRRQTTEHAKHAVGKILEGKHGEAVRGLHTREISIAQDAVRAAHAALDSRPAKDKTAYRAGLKEAAVADNQEVIRRLAQDYGGMDKESRARTLVITATNEDRNAINRAVREELKGRGELHGGTRMDTLEKTGCTDEELKRATTFEKGQVVEFTGKNNTLAVDKGERATVMSANSRTNIVTAHTDSGSVIKFDPARVPGRELYDVFRGNEFSVDDKVAITRNDKLLKVLKGQTGRVVQIEGSLLTVKLESGQTRVFDAEKYKHLCHAYAVTSYKAQGQTIDRVMVHHNTEGGKHGDRETYVNVTRAREDVIVYTQNSDKAALQSGQKLDKEQAMPVAGQIDERQASSSAAKHPEYLLPEGHRIAPPREPARDGGFELGH